MICEQRPKSFKLPIIMGTENTRSSFREVMIFIKIPLCTILASALAASLASCSPNEVADPFDNSGELIALSGGDAGAQAACHTCHGLNGEGDGDLTPRIAGLDAGYLVRQLGFYDDGQRRHPQMSWLAARLDSEERLAVAGYYAAMEESEINALPQPAARCAPGAIASIYHEGRPDRGLASCASCHGHDARGVGAGNPALNGQSGRYLAGQLSRWRSGERYGDALGEMHDAATKLSEEEIIPLTDYIAHGPALSRRRGSPAECP
jgi:cytochrome c553